MHAYVMQDMSRVQQRELSINAKNVLPGASKAKLEKMPVQNAVQARTLLLMEPLTAPYRHLDIGQMLL